MGLLSGHGCFMNVFSFAQYSLSALAVWVFAGVTSTAAGFLLLVVGLSRLAQPRCLALGLQIPSKKVFNPLKTPQSTFLEGIWSPRVDSKYLQSPLEVILLVSLFAHPKM